MSDLSLHIEQPQAIKLNVLEGERLHLSFGGTVYGGELPDFEGPYEVTPSEEAQVLEMEGMRASQSVTVNPIPSNYGLITWDGTKITVS